MLNRWGVGLTLVYLVLLAWLVAYRFDELCKIPLNELGDFLAGAFGPLAIAWLILGFFQQGKELQQSTEALHLQAEELNNSVQQQKELVEVQRQMILLEKENVQYEREQNKESIKPRFVVVDFKCVGWGTSGRGDFKVNFVNVGGNALKVNLSSDFELNFTVDTFPLWNKDISKDVEIKFTHQFPKQPLVLNISFQDEGGNFGEKEFSVLLTETGANSMPRIEVSPK